MHLGGDNNTIQMDINKVILWDHYWSGSEI